MQFVTLLMPLSTSVHSNPIAKVSLAPPTFSQLHSPLILPFCQIPTFIMETAPRGKQTAGFFQPTTACAGSSSIPSHTFITSSHIQSTQRVRELYAERKILYPRRVLKIQNWMNVIYLLFYVFKAGRGCPPPSLHVWCVGSFWTFAPFFRKLRVRFYHCFCFLGSA